MKNNRGSFVAALLRMTAQGEFSNCGIWAFSRWQ